MAHVSGRSDARPVGTCGCAGWAFARIAVPVLSRMFTPGRWLRLASSRLVDAGPG